MAFSVTRFGDGEQIVTTVVNRPINEIVTFLNNETGDSLSVTQYNVGDDISADIMNAPLIQIRDHLNGLAQCSGPLVLDLYVDGEDVTSANLNRPIDQIVQFINNECSFDTEISPTPIQTADWMGWVITANTQADRVFLLARSFGVPYPQPQYDLSMFKLSDMSYLGQIFEKESTTYESYRGLGAYVTSRSYVESTYSMPTTTNNTNVTDILSPQGKLGAIDCDSESVYYSMVVWDDSEGSDVHGFKEAVAKFSIATGNIEWLTVLWGHVISTMTTSSTNDYEISHVPMIKCDDDLNGIVVLGSKTGIGCIDKETGSILWKEHATTKVTQGWEIDDGTTFSSSSVEVGSGYCYNASEWEHPRIAIYEKNGTKEIGFPKGSRWMIYDAADGSYINDFVMESSIQRLANVVKSSYHNVYMFFMNTMTYSNKIYKVNPSSGSILKVLTIPIIDHGLIRDIYYDNETDRVVVYVDSMSLASDKTLTVSNLFLCFLNPETDEFVKVEDFGEYTTSGGQHYKRVGAGYVASSILVANNSFSTAMY